MSDQKEKLIGLIVELDEDEAVSLAKEMLGAGYDPLELLGHCREAMDQVGKLFEEQEYFLPELMMAGELLTEISAIAKPLIQQASDGDAKAHGTVVIGTVHGDLHDIGKNIVSFMLEINGFDVVDLGIDVPIPDFIAAIKEHQPEVIGLSGFLTLAYDTMKTTIEVIEQEGLRDGRRIMIGGGQMDEQIKNHTGADAVGLTAMDAVDLCRDWLDVAA